MTVTNVEKDATTLTMTITTDLDAPVVHVWKLWEDPRQLERWWGPPTYPATFVEHDLALGARITYFMTGPEGDHARGWLRVLAVDAPHHLEFENGFADETFQPNSDMPTTIIRVDLHEHDGGTRMMVATKFASPAAMEQLLAMGMEQGMSAAMSQMDGVLRVESSQP